MNAAAVVAVATEEGIDDEDILRALAGEADLDPEFIEKFIRFVIEEVIRHHQQARDGG